MVEGLGWLNLFLILLTSLIYPIKKVYFKNRKSGLLKIFKVARQLHPLLGFIIVLIGLIHGCLALGSIRLHTGYLILYTIIIMGCITTLGRKGKTFNNTWLSLHRAFVPFLFLFIFVHLFFRNLF